VGLSSRRASTWLAVTTPIMPSTNNENPSPSASSIFLPLGKRARRDSKSSLATELDQDALNQALDTIHTAASQSQVLTVFNEYTDPPPAATRDEIKGIAGDLQGGLSGLYNKLKASVGVTDNVPESKLPVSINKPASHERSASKASSGKTSNMQSPRTNTFDLADSADLTSKISSKTPSITKISSGAPSIKSPTGPSQPASNLADPTLTEVTIHAQNRSTTHSRNTSQNPAGDGNTPSRSNPARIDTDILQKVVSHSTQPGSGYDRPGSRVTSPGGPATGRIKLEHRRTDSDYSIPAINSRPNSPAFAQNDRHKERNATGRQERPLTKPPASNPLDLLADHHPQTNKGSVALAPRVEKEHSRVNKSPSRAERPRERLLPQVSQSRLPGFAASRASSTDSGLTGVRSRNSQIDAITDGSRDVRLDNQGRQADKLRSKLLNREFWMRDENARDCFHCGEPFTTFRRKHHCRTCGQIFDNKCTVLVSGSNFGSMGAVRVCRPCEAIIMSHDDDSSDYSVESMTVPESSTRPRTPDPAHLLQSARFDDDNISVMSQSLEQMARTPTMSLPVRRAYDAGDRSSRVLEFDGERALPRPSSSRSLKATHSIGHGHKRHHSRHQHIRSYKAYHDERAPFQRRTAEHIAQGSKASAFHRDSIIDPDLAQYLSDDASSGDEQSLSMHLSPEKPSRNDADSDRTPISGLLAAVRKGRSRIGDRSIAGFLNFGRDSRDGDDASIISSRPPRKRNLSIASSVHHRLTPRATKERLQFALADGVANAQGEPGQNHKSRVSRMIRSASMHGVGAPAMELNRASIQHVHKLLQQLLRDADVPKISSWEDALVPILLRATDDVDPDVQNGDDIDIRNYVKLKKVLGGKPGDTSYVSGLIFTKNVALKSMSRLVMQPRILIITFALEYSRHEQHFMSLDPVIRQEREYLQNLVSRIAALKPDVLFAQRNISGLALELLDKAKIAVIFNVKSSVLEAVSRCTQTRVIHSVDKLSSLSGQLGTCESFEVKTFVFEGKKKTFVYLSGCPPDLGCTIAIRGGDKKTLHKIKRIAEFMIYVVYNLKLETCLMRDEWALIPTAATDENSKSKPIASDAAEPTEAKDTPSTNTAEPDSLTASGTIQAEVKGPPAEIPLSSSATLDSVETADIPDDIPVPTFYEDMADKHETKILSASPFVKFAPPYILMKARELERRVAYLKRLRDQDLSTEKTMEDKSKSQKFTLIQPEMLHSSLTGTSKKVREIIHAVHDAEYDKAVHNYDTQKKQWEAYLSGNRNLFDPYAHQNIVVLFSFVATATSVPCSGPDLLAFSFYNEHEHEDDFEADCTLGQYVEDLCYRANDSCSSETCEKKMCEHHRQYVHGQAQITVFVQPYPSKMRGLQDVILMWSQCKVCGVETTVTPMSSSTWKYSFGKYLELSFWSADLHARAGICPHDLHRDHLRYFGYKDFALRVHYDPIDLLEIVVPRMRVTWKVDNDLRFRNEVFTKIEHRITRFMSSVKLRLKSINVEAILPENIEGCRAEIDKLLKRANDEHTTLIKQLQERYSNSAHWEILPLNRAIRLTQEKVAEWDTIFTEFEQNYFPSEKDIRRLATLQLKKIFLDRDVSVTSLTSDPEGTSTPPLEEIVDEKMQTLEENDANPIKKTSTLSPEKTQSVLQAVLEEHASPPAATQDAPSTPKQSPKGNVIDELPNVHPDPQQTNDVQHLDLAVPPTPPPQKEDPTHKVPSSQPIAVPNGGVTRPSITSRAGTAINVNDRISTPATPIPVKTQVDDTQDMATPRPPQAIRGASPLIRSQSQPAHSVPMHKDVQVHQAQPPAMPLSKLGSQRLKSEVSDSETSGERNLSERLGLSQLKNSKFVKNHSLIPRAISHRKESRVSNLAKHFEQLSREFERERVRERKQKAARNRQSRIYPLALSKPIVEVYKNVHEAVDEPDYSGDDFDQSPDKTGNVEEAASDPRIETQPPEPVEPEHAEETPAETTETDADPQLSSHAPSEAEDSDIDDGGIDLLPDSPEDLLRLSQEDIDFKELQKHERTSLMKMLTNFWAERSSSGWAPLEYPLAASEHVFADCDILVREDEPSSIIAFALASADYKAMLNDIHETAPTPTIPDEVFGHTHNLEGSDLQSDVMHSLLRKTGTHLKYQFQEGQAKMLCKIFFAEQFDAVRRKCGVADRIIESLSRCAKWDSKGGKTKSLFLKTLDDRFILKSLSPIETQSFLKFAPNYFQIMSEAFFHELPSVIAKMLGFYQIVIKNPITGVEYNWYLLVMENLFYDRVPTRIFDLKGSMRNRKINATGEKNEVLLDENMVEFIYESPLFAREHSKKLLRSSVHNDTLFLARQNVMDYSLMIAIDDHANNTAGHRKDKELVVGIIDCIRTYTWDKKLESWIKDRGFAGGGKNRPTVTSPKEYKRRFREAMGRYVLEAPSCWHQIRGVRVDGGRGDVRREIGRSRDEGEREGLGVAGLVEMEREEEREVSAVGAS
jgi:1-phosphatidylinositol-3-phosphate 5-kinase